MRRLTTPTQMIWAPPPVIDPERAFDVHPDVHHAPRSSGSWRRGLLAESIANYFRKQPEPVMGSTLGTADAHDGSSPPSTSTSSTLTGGIIGDAGPPDQEKKGAAAGDPAATVDPMTSRIRDGVDYKSMTWWQAGMLMVAETISLGILSLPQAMATLGVVPGLILLVSLGALASYTGYVIGQFKMRHPHIHSMGCAGHVLFGRWGGEILGWGQFLFYVFVMGSHILTFSIAMNAITDHARCTIVWMVVGTVLSVAFTLPRTLKNLSYYSVASFMSIIGAVIITMVGLSVTRPGARMVEGRPVLQYRLWPQPSLSFQHGFLAVANIVFAYAGHVAFFTVISELKDARDFPKALAFLQCSDMSMYLVTAMVVYYYAGDGVASPALDSASRVVRKVAYGVALPTIVIAGVVNGHVGVKYLYVRLLRDNTSGLMHQKTCKSYGLWAGICTGSWLAAWLIAESVPVFNDLLGLTSALFASWFTFGLSGMFWMQMNLRRGEYRWQVVPRDGWNCRKTLLLLVNVLNVVVGAILCVAGLYASISSMVANGVTNTPFSCANNAAQ